MRRTAFGVALLALGALACGGRVGPDEPVDGGMTHGQIDASQAEDGGDDASDGSDDDGGVLCAFNIGAIPSCAAAPTAVRVQRCVAPLSECLPPRIIEMKFQGPAPGWGCCTPGEQTVGAEPVRCVFTLAGPGVCP